MFAPTAIRNPQFSRREWLKLSAAGVVGTSLSGWLPLLAQQAAAQKAKPKSCILLWMDGGPSHIDTFDPKPEGAAGAISGRSPPRCPASRSARSSPSSPG